MSPSALTAALKGRLGLAPGMMCLGDWANVIAVPTVMKARTSTWRIFHSSRVSAILYDDAYAWDQTPVENPQPIRAQALHLTQRGRRVVQQRLHVDAPAARRERGQIPRPARQHVDGAVMVQALQVMKGDADLQDALVEVADVARLGAPEQLQRLVLLEELAAIELRDRVDELARRRLFAAHAVILVDDDREAAVEDPSVGRLCHRDDSKEQADYPLRGREDLEPGEPEARAAVHPEGPHLVLQADES